MAKSKKIIKTSLKLKQVNNGIKKRKKKHIKKRFKKILKLVLTMKIYIFLNTIPDNTLIQILQNALNINS